MNTGQTSVHFIMSAFTASFGKPSPEFDHVTLAAFFFFLAESQIREPARQVYLQIKNTFHMLVSLKGQCSSL